MKKVLCSKIGCGARLPLRALPVAMKLLIIRDTIVACQSLRCVCQATSIKDAVDICAAHQPREQPDGKGSRFSQKLSSLGNEQKWPGNYERDFHRYVRREMPHMSEVYECETIVKDPEHATRDVKLSMLLPHEVVHGLYMHNRQKFHELFSTDRLRDFWSKTIERNEGWFVRHPQYTPHKMYKRNSHAGFRPSVSSVFASFFCIRELLLYS